jgi:hypothetical protein
VNGDHPPAALLEAALGAITRYYTALDDFDLDGILSSFSEDVLYLNPRSEGFLAEHPEFAGGIRGQGNLAAFLGARGRQEGRHTITAIGYGFNVATTGEVENGSPVFFAAGVWGTVVSFLATFELDSDGRMRRYATHPAPPAFNLQFQQDEPGPDL